jgi:3-hydroxybutyrate dehydrogenase
MHRRRPLNIHWNREAAASAVRPLTGRISLVTGSTSGIGLGIARALTQAGSTVVLNGLGTGSAIERIRQKISDEFGVDVSYSAADMTKPEAIAEMIAEPSASMAGSTSSSTMPEFGT